MKAIVIASVVLAATAAFAQAQSVDRARNSYAQMSHQPSHQKSVSDSTEVVVSGRVMGRDPSESVRSALHRDYYIMNAAGAEVGGDAGGGAAEAGDASAQ